MLEKIPTPYSPAAADAADRLRLIACDLRLIDLAMTNTRGNGFELNEDEFQAVLMHLRRLISDAETLKDDILTADRKK
ncbi:hypothetical protein AUC71_15245 [Methyloceanibacter marginalis]|uniref:Uncharacterized protein n=1 Tax=Methyloceanibacter marginalis TaxID=1774971 RepID=A0A1E3WAC2_9HYPH|nr:hypothetical protein [Methyloceanibacter marginalis]ODS02462.1 hypothetical protein AUC71_15245 [Methyloceanibacter marginalis]